MLAPPRLIGAGIMVGGAAVSLSLNLPGHLSYDSVMQLAEGRAQVYSGEHPPVMSWLLGICDTLWPGASLFVIFDTVMIYGALLSFVLMGRRNSWQTPLLAGACAASPQLMIYPGIVWKDVLFAGSAAAGFACVAYAAVCWGRPAVRRGLLAAGLLLLTLGALARQNGAIILPFAAAAVGWIAARSGTGAKRWRGWIYGLTFLGASGLIAVGASAALNTRVEGEPALGEQWESLQTYDIVSAISLEPQVDLKVLRSRAPWLEALLRTQGVADYSPVRVDSLEPVFDQIDDQTDGADLIAAQWEKMVLRQPLVYLRVRARAFRWVFLTPAPSQCLLVYTGVDGRPNEMERAGLRRRQTDTDDALARYATVFSSTPVYSHAAYGALGLLLLVGLLRRRRPPDLAVAAMLASALSFAASFAVISIACDYRYLYDLDLAVIAAALFAVATWKDETLT
jgi:uncharacterized protein (TIGR03382 family)